MTLSQAIRVAVACSITMLFAATLRVPVRAADLVTIRVAVSPADDDTAPLLYAKSTGMFERAGLDVQIQRLGSGSAIASAVTGGAIDIGKSSIVSLLAAHQHGIPYSIVGTSALYISSAPFDGFVVAKDSTITTGADLNGKTISTQSLNDVGQLAESAWVDQHGGDSKTLHVTEIPTSAAQAAVESHRVDAAILLEPVLSSALAGGKVRLLGHAFASIAPAFLFAAWFTTNDYAASHVDAIRKFITVIYQAGAYTNTHHKEAAPIVAAQIKLPVDVVQNAQWSPAGTSLDPNQIQPVIDTAAKYGTISKTFSYRDMVNPAFLSLKAR
jgi:NitT/TauT family transport system substrate-binding protein